tara:strand:- start:73 stop:228 length:156 start_codon:yes stop_codon:yes gene_type:complete
MIERIIDRLKALKDLTKDQKKNVQINIQICEMQIGLRAKHDRQNQKKWNSL